MPDAARDNATPGSRCGQPSHNQRRGKPTSRQALPATARQHPVATALLAGARLPGKALDPAWKCQRRWLGVPPLLRSRQVRGRSRWTGPCRLIAEQRVPTGRISARPVTSLARCRSRHRAEAPEPSPLAQPLLFELAVRLALPPLPAQRRLDHDSLTPPLLTRARAGALATAVPSAAPRPAGSEPRVWALLLAAPGPPTRTTPCPGPPQPARAALCTGLVSAAAKQRGPLLPTRRRRRVGLRRLVRLRPARWRSSLADLGGAGASSAAQPQPSLARPTPRPRGHRRPWRSRRRVIHRPRLH